MATRTRGSERATAEAERVLDLLNSLGSTTFRQLLWQKASELDLTYAQSQVLFYVAEHPGCHMGEVAKAFGVTLPAVTHIVDRLEQKEFLLRLGARRGSPPRRLLGRRRRKAGALRRAAGRARDGRRRGREDRAHPAHFRR